MSKLKRTWLPALVVMLLVSLLMAACGRSAPATPAAQGDRPTMLYFYTDN